MRNSCSFSTAQKRGWRHSIDVWVGGSYLGRSGRCRAFHPRTMACARGRVGRADGTVWRAVQPAALVSRLQSASSRRRHGVGRGTSRATMEGRFQPEWQWQLDYTISSGDKTKLPSLLSLPSFLFPPLFPAPIFPPAAPSGTRAVARPFREVSLLGKDGGFNTLGCQEFLISTFTMAGTTEAFLALEAQRSGPARRPPQCTHACVGWLGVRGQKHILRVSRDCARGQSHTSSLAGFD